MPTLRPRATLRTQLLCEIHRLCANNVTRHGMEWRIKVDIVKTERTLSAVDRDVFSKVSRLGRDAGQAIMFGVTGGDFDPFPCAKVIDKVMLYAGGVPSWPRVKQVLDAFRAEPLFAAAKLEQTAQAIDAACRSEGGDLDNVLRQAAIGSLLAGHTTPEAAASRFFLDVVDRAVLSPRGGCFERMSVEQRRMAREMVRPLSEEAARLLTRNPNLKQTMLARRYRPSIEADSNLLGLKP